MSRKTVYIFSEDNSSSLQMVEGFIREYLNIDKWNVQTGARQKNLLNPLAVEVMHEIGIDIRNQSSNLVDLSFVSQADYIINLKERKKKNLLFQKSSKRDKKSSTGVCRSRRVILIDRLYYESAYKVC